MPPSPNTVWRCRIRLKTDPYSVLKRTPLGISFAKEEPGKGEEGGMIEMEAWTTIRYLHAQGKGKKTIARELGISRNTVRRALGRGGPPRYERSPRPNQQLAPLGEAIREMRQQGLIGSRILREVRQRGYAGSRTALYDFLEHLKARSQTRGYACATRPSRGSRSSSTGAHTPWTWEGN